MGVAESGLDVLVGQIDSQVAEFEQKISALRTAREALMGDHDSAAGPASPSAPSRKSSNGRRRGRPRGGGNRAVEAINLVTEQPGISIPEMAQKMGIQPNYLYRVLPKLKDDGQVKRDGSGWFPVS